MNPIFRLKDILYGIRKHLTVIVGMTLGGLLVGIMVFVVQTLSASNVVSYQVFSSFSVSTANHSGIFVNGTDSPGNGDFDLAPKLVDPIAYICRSEKVCAQVVNQLNLIGVKTKDIQNALKLTQYGETPIVEITLRWKDADEGTLILNTVMELLPGAIQEVLNVGAIEKIEGPVVTAITTEVGFKIVVLLAGIGFLLGMMYCFSQLYMHPTLIEIKDVGELFDINLLSSISEEPSFSGFMRENLITNRQDMAVNMRESYTALAHILLHQVEEDHFSLFVTSASRGEGRTTVVSNLGMELAALDKRVLLIDFDLTSPSLGSFFLDEIDYMHTVNAVYFDDTSVQKAIIRINENLYLLPARLDKRHMGVDRFAKKLVAQMENEYDVVLIDTAPVGESSETLYFSNVSNSAMFVIRYDYTSCDVIEESIEKLQKTNTVIHGAVVNCVPHAGLTGSPWEAAGRQKQERAPGGKLPGLFGQKPDAGQEKPKRDAARYEMENDDDLVDDAIVADVLTAEVSPTQKRRNQPMQRDDDDGALLSEGPDAAQEESIKEKKTEAKKTEEKEIEEKKTEEKKIEEESKAGKKAEEKSARREAAPSPAADSLDDELDADDWSIDRDETDQDIPWDDDDDF